MSTKQNTNILEFEIVVNVKATEQSKQTLKELQDAKKTTQEIRQATRDQKRLTQPQYAKSPLAFFNADEFIAQQSQLATQQQAQIKKETLEFLQKLDSKGLQTLSAFATNPTGATMNALTKLLTMAGADASIFLGVIGLAITAPVVIQQLIQALSVKGGPLNRDWVRYLGKEVDAGLSRMEVKRREQGLDVVTLSQRIGFAPNNQNWYFNTLFEIDDKRIARIGLTDRAAGVYTS